MQIYSQQKQLWHEKAWFRLQFGGKIARVSFSKDSKQHESKEQVQFVAWKTHECVFFLNFTRSQTISY